MSKKKEDTEAAEAFVEDDKEIASPETARAVATGEAAYTREDIAAAKKFKEHKWIVYAVIAKGELVTLKEAQRRINNYLNRKI